MKEKENNKMKLENTEPLTFMDGILLTKKIYETVLKKQLSNEKDKNGYSYLGIINDDIRELLNNKILEHGYFVDRGFELTNRFGIDL